jgi:hypothetical protein
MRKIWLATVLLTSACVPTVTSCPAIAQAPVVTLTVLESYVPVVRTVHLKACQSGVCKEGDLALAPGTKAVNQGCEGPDAACHATSFPDGTLYGLLWLDLITDDPIDATVSGVGADGEPLPVRTIAFTPKLTQCPKFITASLVLDAHGMRQA